MKKTLDAAADGDTADSVTTVTTVADTVTDAVTDDENFIAHALRLAERGVNTSHPNPRVGAVVVAAGGVVGEGWHRAAGEIHAEVAALHAAGKRARGATLYVTLAPCNHHGRTPPCVDAIVKAGVARVVAAVDDPDPRAAGGVDALRDAGVTVTVGVGEAAARKLNRGFIKRLTDGVPWVTLKMAASLDGKTAMADGASRWITGEDARRDAHKLRAAASAILTGVGTVLRDDPKMTARVDDGDDDDGATRQPLRVVLDGNLSTPPSAKILTPPGRALIITGERGAGDAELLRGDNVEVIVVGEHAGRIDLQQVMTELAAREINEVLLEAGPRLAGAMLAQDLVDELVVYLAPDLLGGDARGMFDIPGLAAMDDRRRLSFAEVRRVGRDLRLTLTPVSPSASPLAAAAAPSAPSPAAA